MTATHRLTATFSPLAKPSQADADDLLAHLLGVFHERMPVVAASAVARPRLWHIDVAVDVALAGAGEEEDVVERVLGATAFPPVDNVRLRPRRARTARPAARCDAYARKGTGTGVCDRPLDGETCDRPGDHLDA